MNNQGLIILRKNTIVQVKSSFPIMPKFKAFSFAASTAGQRQFTLPTYPTGDGLLSAFINGFSQDPLVGDYVIDGQYVTLKTGLAIGDVFYGLYMEGAPVSSNQPYTFQTFFFNAAAGQTTYTLLSIPLYMLSVVINGTTQSQQAGDFTVNGLNLVINAPQNLGDKVFGVYVRA